MSACTQKTKGVAYRPQKPANKRGRAPPPQADPNCSSLKGYELREQGPPETAAHAAAPAAAEPAAAANGAQAAKAQQQKARPVQNGGRPTQPRGPARLSQDARAVEALLAERETGTCTSCAHIHACNMFDSVKVEARHRQLVDVHIQRLFAKRLLRLQVQRTWPVPLSSTPQQAEARNGSLLQKQTRQVSQDLLRKIHIQLRR